MDTLKILKREEVPEEYTWNLSDMFPDDGAWEKEYEDIKTYPERLKRYEGKIGESASVLLEFFKTEDEVSERLSALYGYANCKSDQDTANGFYQNMRGKAMGVYVDVDSALSFASSEINEIPENKLNEFYVTEPALEVYRRNIYSIRRKKSHILSAECEKLLASAGEMSASPDNIRGALCDADMKYGDVTDSSGKIHTLTDGTFVPLLESPDRAFRERVYKSYYERLGGFKNTIAATLDAQFKQLRFFANSRNYTSSLEAALDDTEVPVAVYENLIKTVNANLDKMYNYVSLRKTVLGVDELKMYDVYTPIVADVSVDIPFEEAKKTVLEALSVLGEDYTDLLKIGFNNRWIDIYENEGKRSGAYSTGFGKPHPYVLLNHKNTLDCEFTLAHEMGHALHSYYSCKHQPTNTNDYVIFVAEVASTCNEVLLMRYLLSKTEDKKVRAYLINHFLDQFKGTIYRQTMFAEFELEMGNLSENGQTLTADLLSEKYLELNKKYFGPDMVSDKNISLEWARIPHFFYNYYVFQYATGFSAAVAIADRILTLGKPAVEDYKKFLSGGCGTDPISLLKIAGVDMSTPEPINSALGLFGELVDELKNNI